MTYVFAVGLGMTAGTHVATWGMFKDAPHEGFFWRRYLRGIALAVGVAMALTLFPRVSISEARDLVPYFGVVYAVERVLTELWKLTIRDDNQGKYAIPMRLAVRRHVVDARAARYAVGVFLVIVLTGAAAVLYHAQLEHRHATGWIVVLLVGGAGGWFSALGGAYKDAPVEGFDWLKFPRSPLTSLAWSVPLATFTTNWVVLAVGAGGYSVATIETYKKFWAPQRPPGKFSGKPIAHPEMLTRRRWFRLLFVGLWLAIIAVLVTAFVQPHHGLLAAGQGSSR